MPANEAPTRRDETEAVADVSVTVSGDAADLEVTTTEVSEPGTEPDPHVRATDEDEPAGDVLDLDGAVDDSDEDDGELEDEAELENDAPVLALSDVDEPDVLDIDDEDVPLAPVRDLHPYEDDEPPAGEDDEQDDELPAAVAASVAPADTDTRTEDAATVEDDEIALDAEEAEAALESGVDEAVVEDEADVDEDDAPAEATAEATTEVTPEVTTKAPAEDEAAPEQPEPGKPDLAQSVERLRTHVATLSLTLDLDSAAEARRERELLLRQLDDYLLPRLRRRDAPLLAVIGGSTGAGKSTLTNSIVRREVTRSGVLRPTTRSPVLVHHPFDSGAFLSQRILPRLVRVTSEAPEPMQPIDPNAPRITGLRLVPHDGLTPGMAIIDAPDIDSLVETNRELAVQLLGAADLWIFVTTAARYADAMPWEMLKQAADRGVAVAVVLDRVPPEVLPDLRVHLAQRLRDRGLGGAPLFALPETTLVDGFLPAPVVKPLQQWLTRVAGDARSREVIADRTLNGVVASLPTRAELLADAATAQSKAWTTLMDDVDRVFTSARARLLSGLTNGSLIGGEVQARWQEYVTDGGVVQRLDGSEGGLGDRVSAAVRQDEGERRPLDVPVTFAARATVQASIRAAAEVVLVSWRTRPYGPALLEARGHQLSLSELSEQIELSLGNWRQALVDAAGQLAKQEDGDRKLDADAVSDVLFVVTMDERPETSGVDPATVAPARRILSGIVGDEAVRSVVGAARADLVSRSAVLLDSVRLKLERMLEAGGVDERRGTDLRAAAENVEKAR